jgi:hypothetical protein
MKGYHVPLLASFELVQHSVLGALGLDRDIAVDTGANSHDDLFGWVHELANRLCWFRLEL